MKLSKGLRTEAEDEVFLETLWTLQTETAELPALGLLWWGQLQRAGLEGVRENRLRHRQGPWQANAASPEAHQAEGEKPSLTLFVSRLCSLAGQNSRPRRRLAETGRPRTK